jgi:AraC family transcriptional regulator
MFGRECYFVTMPSFAAPRIENLREKKFAGKHLRMSLLNDRTLELWQSFMPFRKNISNKASSDLFSLQVYDKPLTSAGFDPLVEFEKWALQEVLDFGSIPEGMEPYTLKGGLYAVFVHRGLPRTFPTTFQRISNWVQHSEYAIDHREHFEVLGDRYKRDDPASEEEVWIPIKRKPAF